MTVESQVGVGTTFKFNIQTYAVITEQIEQTAPSRQVVGLLAGQPTYRILVVEDKPENQQLMMELLTPVGFDVCCAINGQDAINIWQSWSPHLIWMDMRMPVLNGYEATKQIKAIGNPATIVIALSGSAFEEDKMTALSVGCDDFVRKPFRTEVIFSKIALHLGVGYIYAEDSRSSHRESLMTAPVDSLTPQDIAVMPSEWVAQLHNFALKVNAKQIMQLITHIPEQNAYLAMALTSLVNNFEFEKIVELTNT